MTGKNENVNYKPMFLLSAMFMGIIGSGFMSKEDMPVQNVPSIVQQKQNLKLFVDAPVSITAGDLTSINKIVDTVMKNNVPAMVTPVLKNKEGLTSVYQLGEYEITLENFDLKNSTEQEIFVSIRKAESGAVSKDNSLVLNSVNDVTEAEGVHDVVTTYKLKVNVTDHVKPVITTTQDEDTITEGDDFDENAYIESAIDDVDGEIDYVTESDVDVNEPGTYTVTYRATDKAGNEGHATVYVTVEELEEEEPVVVEEEDDYYSGYNTPAYAGSNAVSVNGSGVAGAALSQLGQYQDCTSLVSRALAAQGISFGGYPSSYLSLGNIVSGAEAQPGDIIYYADGGVGAAHVAVYVGNGQAVHGGFNGNQTVLASAYLGSGPVFVHIAQ